MRATPLWTTTLLACAVWLTAVAAAPPAAIRAVDQPASPPPPTSAQHMATQRLDQVLAGSWRPDSSRVRDRYRHPQQTLQFFGVSPGQNLIEITPGGGWYAEVLAPLLAGSGHYTAAVIKPSKPGGEAAQDDHGLRKKFAADPVHYGDAKIIEFDARAPDFGPPGSADVVLTFRNAHNWVAAGTQAAMFKAFYQVLKPGGTLGVVDHRAAPGSKAVVTQNSGYLPQAYVIKLAADAGFKLVATSEINANPKDDRNHPKGVWTLPPTYALGAKDRAKYAAIGESDRMTLRFVKPAHPSDTAAR